MCKENTGSVHLCADPEIFLSVCSKAARIANKIPVVAMTSERVWGFLTSETVQRKVEQPYLSFYLNLL